jgi:hypothetical protein
MSGTRKYYFVAFLLATSLCLCEASPAMTAKEIVEKAQKSQAGESFRAAVQVETFRGEKRVSQHSLWIMGQLEKNESLIFLDFTDPEDSKGVRVLCRIKPDQDPTGYMYLPATNESFSIDVQDPGLDIGGTGLTMADFRPLIPQKGEIETLLKEEEVNGLPCYLIQIAAPEGKEQRLVWITKDRFDLTKLEQKTTDGKIQRTMRVVEFFEAKDGKRYPREEEITLPSKGIKIKVRQDNAVFGIVMPEELTDPKTFGNFKWQI